MADAEQLDKIKALHIERTGMLELIWDHDGAPRDILESLAQSWLTEAALTSASGKRGAKSLAAGLTEAARLLNLDVARLRNAPTAPPTKPVLVPSANLLQHRPSELGTPQAQLPGPGGRCASGNVHDEHTTKCACGFQRDESYAVVLARVEHAIVHPETLVTRDRPRRIEDVDLPMELALQSGQQTLRSLEEVLTRPIVPFTPSDFAPTVGAELAKPICVRCDTETHLCPGCGVNVEHGQVACDACNARTDEVDVFSKDTTLAYLSGAVDTLPEKHSGECDVQMQCVRCSIASDRQYRQWRARHGVRPGHEALHPGEELRVLDHAEALAIDIPVDTLPEPLPNGVTITVNESMPHGQLVPPIEINQDTLATVLDEPQQEQDTHREVRSMTETFPIASPFREASTPPAPAWAPPRPANVPADLTYSWSALSLPAERSAIPEHVSPSQLSTMDKCPAQARLSRYTGDGGMPGIPLWGGIGGTAFHACVEEIELGVSAGKQELVEWSSYPEMIQRVWVKRFHQAIAEEHAKGHGIPMDRWYASNKGKENYSWWLEEGAAMVARYVDYRRAHDDGRTVLVLPDGRPAIELELTLDLGDLPVKVILDIAWLLPNGDIEIWDHKTGSRTPEDSIQLGTQAHALRAELDRAHGGPWKFPCTITARYFDARKGVPLESYDILTRHPIEELELRYADLDDRRRNRPAVPRPSAMCVACPMRWLCPAGDRR